MSSIAISDTRQQEIVEEFQFFDDWMDRYQYIIDLGKALPDLDAQYKVDENLLHGCQSQVWLVHRGNQSSLHFSATSDSAIVKGLIALMLRVYSDRSASEILATEPEFIEAIGLKAHLSPTRSNGLHALWQAIRAHAESALAEDLA